MSDAYSVKLSGLVRKVSVILILWLIFIRMSPVGTWSAALPFDYKPTVILLFLSALFGWMCVESIREREDNSWKEPKAKASCLFIAYVLFLASGIFLSV